MGRELDRRSSAPTTPGMLDAELRVTGRVPYAIDEQRPGMLHARLLRSPHPHARILRIDTAGARAVPGVRLVLTGADLAARPDLLPYFGPVFRDQPILAIDTARFAGDPVAAVVADDLDAAAEAIERIAVEYEALPAVFTIDDALAPGAPLVHPEPPRRGPTFADVIVHTEVGSNVCNHFVLRKGDVEAGFAAADHVFEDVFSSPPVQHVPLETHACVAWFEAGVLTVVSATQTPFPVRSTLAEVFGLPEAKVRVIVRTLGGGYGSKTYPKIEPVTAVLAWLAGRPVRLHLGRDEEFVTITKHGVGVRMRTGVATDGRIVARQVVSHFNTGAYADIGPRLIKNGGFAMGGPHNIPNVAIDSYAVYTNLPPAGAFRGYGVSQAAWAYETQMDMIARRLGWDPLWFRMQNLLVDGNALMTGEPMREAHLRPLLATAAEWIGWEGGTASPVLAPSAAVSPSQSRKVRGKGLACVIKGTGTPSTSTAAAKLNEDGSLQILASAVEMGQGAETALVLEGAAVLGLPAAAVTITRPDTQATPYEQMTSSSRTTYSTGTAVRMAVGRIRDQLLTLAADALEAAPADLELADGQVRVRGVPDRSMGLGALVRRARAGNLLGSAVFSTDGGLDSETGQGVASVHWHQAAGAAEVEVDLDTGRVELIRYHAGVYAGRVVNPVPAQLQTEGNVAFGVGQALFEELVFDHGQPQNANLADYMIASIEDLPAELSLGILEDLEANELHGIGETALPPVMAAVGNAVFQATGVRVTDLPITPQKVLRGLRELAATRAPISTGSRPPSPG